MNEPSPDLRDQLQVELRVAPPTWDDDKPVRIEDATALERQGDAYTVSNNTWIWLKLTNTQPSVPLNIALLDLSSRWEIELVIPNPHELRGQKYETIGDRPRVFPFKMVTLNGAVIDTLKLFISIGDVDFRALATLGVRTYGGSNAPGRLIDAINATELGSREVHSGRSLSSPWTVQEFRIRTLP